MTFDWDPVIPRLLHDARALLRKPAMKAQLLDRQWGDAPPELRALLSETIAAQANLDLFFRRFGALREAHRGAPEEALPIGTVVKLAARGRRDKAASAGATVEIGELGEATVLPSLQGALEELLDNAMTFTVADRPVQIAIRAQPNGHYLKISVSDNGSGWDPALGKKMFWPLERLDLRGGFGLGLAIAKALVERADGSIEGNTSPAGSTFTISLPC